MKIGVILRQLSFFYGSELGIDPSSNELNYSAMITTLNPYDEGALILALEQKDLNPKIEVFVAAMDSGHDAGDLLKKGINLGADKGVLLKNDEGDPIYFNEDVYKWSKWLAAIDWEIFLIGANKIDTQEDEFGVFLGEYLNVPVVSGIVNLQILTNKKIKCWRKLEKGNREIVECELPALLTVEQINKVRYPSLKRIAAPKEQYIINFYLKEGLEKEKKEKKIILQEYRPARVRPKKGLFELNRNLSSTDRLDQLLSGGIDKKEKISGDELRGTPDELAQKVLDYLIKIRII